jgi:aspartate aminotransferase-like enzyme
VASAHAQDVQALASDCHAHGALLLVDATLVLGGCELRTDDWGIDVCVAGVDHCLGAPPGLGLVTYTERVEAAMQQRRTPPPTSYLDLLQLQAYWSPERLNHHTAPTSLVYGLHEALRLVHAEGLEARWARHQRVFAALVAGLHALQLDVVATAPVAIVRLPDTCQDEAAARQRLQAQFGVHVQRAAERTWRLGLLGADAQLGAVTHLLSALEQVLDTPSRAVAAALATYGART